MGPMSMYSAAALALPMSKLRMVPAVTEHSWNMSFLTAEPSPRSDMSASSSRLAAPPAKYSASAGFLGPPFPPLLADMSLSCRAATASSSWSKPQRLWSAPPERRSRASAPPRNMARENSSREMRLSPLVSTAQKASAMSPSSEGLAAGMSALSILETCTFSRKPLRVVSYLVKSSDTVSASLICFMASLRRMSTSSTPSRAFTATPARLQMRMVSASSR
mmetsp:Transcript_4901/g.13670  ORF Transcript_4901/g.13670 Transcript_4901/m.13670 type:complete len:220 (-) Transcript_4901:2916-3575(-)